MKRVLVTLAILALCFILLPWGCYRVIWPSYAWNQKLTLTVETPQGEVSGSGVVRVVWSDSPDLFGDAPHWHSKVRGEATVVDLGEEKYLFALIHGAERLVPRVLDGGRLPQDTDAVGPLAAEYATYMYGTTHDVIRKATPMLVTFSDITDPTTVRRVDPDDLAASFGPGYSLKSVTLEITDEPVESGRVETLLYSWLQMRSGPKKDPPPLKVLYTSSGSWRYLSVLDFWSIDLVLQIYRRQNSRGLTPQT
jgi:hypothetical protein